MRGDAERGRAREEGTETKQSGEKERKNKHMMNKWICQLWDF
jgi:hypothetical protein